MNTFLLRMWPLVIFWKILWLIEVLYQTPWNFHSKSLFQFLVGPLYIFYIFFSFLFHTIFKDFLVIYCTCFLSSFQYFCFPFSCFCRHNLFLHSALVLSRKTKQSTKEINVKFPCYKKFIVLIYSFIPIGIIFALVQIKSDKMN